MRHCAPKVQARCRYFALSAAHSAGGGWRLKHALPNVQDPDRNAMHTLAVFLTSDPLVSWRYTQSRRVHAAPYWHSGMRVLDACFFFVFALKCKVFPVLHCERPMPCGIVYR